MSELLELVNERKKSALEELREHAPTVALVFANALIIFGEIRVYDVVHNMTGSIWKGLGATLSTGIPFLVWEFLWTYRHARGLQKALALFGEALAFGVGVILGAYDYLIGTVTVPTVWLLVAVVVALGLHALALFVFFHIDPGIEAERTRAEADAAMQKKREDMFRAHSLLNTAKEVLAFQQNLERRFGKAEVRAMLDQLAGRKSVGMTPETVGTTAKELPQPVPTEDEKPTPKAPKVLAQAMEAMREVVPVGTRKNGKEPTDFP